MSDNQLFSLDSEVAVLSSILQTPSLVHLVDGLKSHMFSSSPNQVLFGEFEELKEKNLVPDPTVVIGDLESKGLLDDIGGRSYIDFLLKKTPSDEGSFKALVQIVISSYKARTYISILSGVNKSSLSASNVDESIIQTKKGLDFLLQMKENDLTFFMGDEVDGAYKIITDRMSNPGIRGSSWGISTLDEATGGKSPGDLMVISGRPGSGKTALICNSILADAKEGVPSLLIEREMRKQEIIERLISIDSGVPNMNIRLGFLDKEQLAKTKESLDKFRNLPIYIDVNSMVNDPLYFESTVTKFRNKHGVKNVYLDYVQLATERDNEQTQAIGRITRMSKLLANDLDVCMILLSQLNRNVESREDKRPLLSDMKQSGSIEDDADFVIGLYRDEYYYKETKAKGLMEYIILKHRSGPVGTVTVKYDGPTYRITEA